MSAISVTNLERFRRLSKEGSWIVLGQVLFVLGSIVSVRILSEYLEPVQFGELALGLTLAALINQVVLGGLINGISRFYSIALEKNDLWSYLRASFRLMAYSTVLVAAIAPFILTLLVWCDHSHWINLAVSTMIFSMLNGYNSALSGIQNAARQRAIVAFHAALGSWLRIGLLLILLKRTESSSTMIIVIYSLSVLLVTSSQFFFLRRLVSPHKRTFTNINWVKQIWEFSWPISTWGIFSWAQQNSDRWALHSFASTAEVGLYAVVFQLGYGSITIASGLVESFIAPILYQRLGSGADQGRTKHAHHVTWQITFFCLCLTAFIFVLTTFTHKWIFHLLVSEQYRFVSHLMPWGILAGGIFAAGQVLSIKLMADLKTAKMIFAKIFTAIVGVVLNICGAFYFGLSGVVAMLVVFASIYFIWMALLCRSTEL